MYQFHQAAATFAVVILTNHKRTVMCVTCKKRDDVLPRWGVGRRAIPRSHIMLASADGVIISSGAERRKGGTIPP